ncbi:tetratricopeptide (TPR) repeat protein [Chitinivorax tropicus]|uniref:Tetratricopeptide (TPR) repeat protein n=1 Tax=Chitinivorax tropicus TaxID=714531 RepID=A0A840MQA8_9PROT|nr:tetratricopeptide repeat protein [Chitinivorax tropicus]MBB5020620.1 tetratricopeptide (TPR) repeat protein [Chitinivorax tropicus]
MKKIIDCIFGAFFLFICGLAFADTWPRVFFQDHSFVAIFPNGDSGYRFAASGGAVGKGSSAGADCTIQSDLSLTEGHRYSGQIRPADNSLHSFSDKNVKGKIVDVNLLESSIEIISVDVFGLCSLNSSISGVYKEIPISSSKYANALNFFMNASLESAGGFFNKGKNEMAADELSPYVLGLGDSGLILRFPIFLKLANDFGYYKQLAGDHDSAISAFENVLSISPGRIVTYLNLADSLWQVGKFDRAREEYKKYFDLMGSAGKAGKIPDRVKLRM